MTGAPGQGLEIERVWVLQRMPAPIPSGECWEIDQGYLPTEGLETAADFPEGRIRRIRTESGAIHCRHTVKRGAGLVREETEREISVADFERLWPLTINRRLSKTRYRIRNGDLTWELDRFHDLPLVMLEVELPSERTTPVLPTWTDSLIVREVTFDPRYRNAALAIEGMPQDG